MPTTSLEDATARLSAYVESVYATHERVIITRDGEPSAVLMSAAELASLEETIAVLSDPFALTEIAAADESAVAGELIDVSDVRPGRPERH